MTIKSCFECSGEMVKPKPIHSYDFNKEGYVPFYCLECGLCSDWSEIIEAKGYRCRISHGFVNKILKILCNREMTFSYQVKKELYHSLQEEDFFSAYQLADEIVLKAKQKGIEIEWDFVLTTIYQKLSINALV